MFHQRGHRFHPFFSQRVLQSLRVSRSGTWARAMGPANSAEKHGDVSDDDSKDGVPEYGASGITKEVGKLIGGLEPWNFMTFHSVGNVIIPIDFHNYFSEL